MAAESIIVYIDPSQLKAQKQNNYNLYLAKMVNGQFTVIWQSLSALGSVGSPSYEIKNTFNIEVPSFGLNYGTVTTSEGSVTFEAGGKTESIDLGQAVQLDDMGLFGKPTYTGGATGKIIVNNELAANPHEILLDNAGNTIFVNTKSGMDVGGPATLTPIDTYQIWFDSIQDTGTIIANNVSAVATVTFSGEASQEISYNSDGKWVPGSLVKKVDLAAVIAAQKAGDPLTLTLVATFKYALTAGAVTYLLSKLIDKFSSGLRPTKIHAKAGHTELTIEFDAVEHAEIAAVFGPEKFEAAVNRALSLAKKDSASELSSETWTVGMPTVAASY